jgi:hypothetical protein
MSEPTLLNKPKSANNNTTKPATSLGNTNLAGGKIVATAKKTTLPNPSTLKNSNGAVNSNNKAGTAQANQDKKNENPASSDMQNDFREYRSKVDVHALIDYIYKEKIAGYQEWKYRENIMENESEFGDNTNLYKQKKSDVDIPPFLKEQFMAEARNEYMEVIKVSWALSKSGRDGGFTFNPFKSIQYFSMKAYTVESQAEGRQLIGDVGKILIFQWALHLTLNSEFFIKGPAPIRGLEFTQIPATSFTSRIFYHYTDASGIAGITGVPELTLNAMKVGETITVKSLKFGAGTATTFRENVGDIFITELPPGTSSGALSQIGIFGAKQQFTISFSEYTAFEEGVKPSLAKLGRSIYTIPANSTINGSFTVIKNF